MCVYAPSTYYYYAKCTLYLGTAHYELIRDIWKRKASCVFQADGMTAIRGILSIGFDFCMEDLQAAISN